MIVKTKAEGNMPCCTSNLQQCMPNPRNRSEKKLTDDPMIEDRAINKRFSHLAGRTTVSKVKARLIEQVECQKIQCLMRIVKLHLERFGLIPPSISSYFFVYSFFEPKTGFHHSWGAFLELIQ